MVGGVVAGVATAMLAGMTAASAQAAHAWADIDCAASRIAPFPETTCRATNPATGSESVGGRSQRHLVRSANGHGYMLVYLTEGFDPGSSVSTRMPVIDYVKALDRRAADGSEWSSAARHGNADYATFKSDRGEACVGFRKLGDSRGYGYAWFMVGLLCAPRGQPLQFSQIARFVDSAKPRE